LNRGVVSDDDDDDDAPAKAGMNASTSTVGKFSLRLGPTHQHPGHSSNFPLISFLVTEKKKKRKRSKKKKTKNGTLPVTELKQTTPPRVLLSTLFPSGYPSGELVPYENLSRNTDEESRYNSRLWDEEFLADYRQAAEIHRQVRQYAQKELIKPGASLLAIAEGIENGVRALSGHQGIEIGDGLKASMGFPTGLCLNNVAAHWTPNPGGKEVFLQESDVLKVDFGVQINGRIVDSAFTVAFDHKYDNLLAAVREATNTGIMVSILLESAKLRSKTVKLIHG
jgi:methionyl aminopeptidase